MAFKTAFNKIQKLIKDSKNAPDKIGSLLVSSRITHLSFSMISSYETCPQKYYLEYVRQIRLQPEPAYFVKGKALHSAAQNLYSRNMVNDRSKTISKKMLRGIKDATDIKHIENAVDLMIKNRWDTIWKVLAIERPFVMQIHAELPPLFGIIDLVLSNGNQYAVVDHKTSNTFYNLDPMQLVFYREFVRKEFNVKKIDAYYDQYRWVNNLERVRKPAFLRSKVQLKTTAIDRAVTRAKRAYAGMRKITGPVDRAFSDVCYQCQYREHCS